MSRGAGQTGGGPHGPKGQEDYDQQAWDRQKHQEYIVAINALTHQLKTGQYGQDANEGKKAFREWLTIWLVVGTFSVTLAGDGIFYFTMLDARSASLRAHGDSARQLYMADGAAQDAIIGARIDGERQLKQAAAQFRADERPYVWKLDQTPFWILHYWANDRTGFGAASWDLAFQNIGKTPAYDVTIQTYVKIGVTRSYRRSCGEHGRGYGFPLPPGDKQYVTARSCPTLTHDELDKIAATENGTGVMADVQYRDAYGTPYETIICEYRQANGIMHLCKTEVR